MSIINCDSSDHSFGMETCDEEKDVEIFYRVDYHPYSGDTIALFLSKFKVVKKTPCGVWIIPLEWEDLSEKRFINLSHRKKFANPTIEEALTSFMARKKRQLVYIRSNLIDVEEAIEAAKVCSFNEFDVYEHRHLRRHHVFNFNIGE